MWQMWQMRQRDPCVYIMASQRNGTLYIGVTSDLRQRVWQHKSGAVEGFTKEYAVTMLVYTEHFPTMQQAIRREKSLKKWKREWKIRLIESQNPDWDDLDVE